MENNHTTSDVIDVLTYVASLVKNKQLIQSEIKSIEDLKNFSLAKQRDMSLLLYNSLEAFLCPSQYQVPSLRKMIVDNFSIEKLRSSFIDVLLPENEQQIRKIEREIKKLIIELLPLIGDKKINILITEKTQDNLLSGIKIDEEGMIDFSVAEERFFQLPIAWLKLVEKFLREIVDLLIEERAKIGSVQEKKEIIQVSPEVKKVFSSVGLQDFIEKGILKDLPATVYNKEQEHIPVSITGNTLKDDSGAIQGMVVVAKDLRNLKKYAKERLRDITPVLKKVANGDFSQKIDIPKTEDEFTDHMLSLNVMVDDFRQMVSEINKKSEELSKQNAELEKASEALKEAKEGLEDKVKERTQELEKAKEGLEEKVAQRTSELHNLNLKLEEKVNQRTVELQEKLVELRRFNKIAIDRELKMVELKKEISKLKGQNN